MAYDTIRLRSPYLDPQLVEAIEQKCILRKGIHVETGELLYELYAGQLEGSWDARISVTPKHDEWENTGKGTPQLVKSPFPYLIVEASVHKLLLGHNIYGGHENFEEACDFFHRTLSDLLEVKLPDVRNWRVLRVDVAHVYQLSLPASREFFAAMQLVDFPRRKKNASKYDMAVHFPGSTTTVKFYHKGTEFREHEYPRLRGFFSLLFSRMYPNLSAEDLKALINKKIKALQRLADNRLRVEVGINSEKFLYDFNDRHPYVKEVTDAYLQALHDREVERILREGKMGMDTVRTTDAVWNRLNRHYDLARGNRLFGFWQSLCTGGIEKTKLRYTKPTFYRNRKLLEEAGVSWIGSDIHVQANDSLIHDFAPIRGDRRLCYLPARNRPDFNKCRDELLAA